MREEKIVMHNAMLRSPRCRCRRSEVLADTVDAFPIGVFSSRNIDSLIFNGLKLFVSEESFVSHLEIYCNSFLRSRLCQSLGLFSSVFGQKFLLRETLLPQLFGHLV